MARSHGEGKPEATGRALLDHWRWAASRGLMNPNTANGLRSACAKVLGVVDGWEEVDVKSLDVGEALTRFQNLKKRDYAPAVLETYKRRFRIALASYLGYLRDPGGWTPGIVERPGRADRKDTRDEGRPAESSALLPATGFVEFPFPLREGQFARLVLPRDLKASEVKRLTAFMNTLVLNRDKSGAE
ncbi:MAG TPA: hypothetical protein VEU07_16925 [Candidatus Acidoferrum sp.]|nr:hypothetical protein [Candidatus Acidoferrum sp.]